MYYLRYYWILYIYCTSAGIFSLYLFIHQHYESAKRWAAHDEGVLEGIYDYIVVGGGSAGSIVAGRLAEDPNVRVLLIESGGKSSLLHDIPLSAPMIQGSPYDWQYTTVPQKNSCLGLTDQVSRWPMGKILGGTSRLNYMIYLRGHKSDFEEWSNGEDWTYEDVLYYFKKWENHQGRFKSDRRHHGRNGPGFVSDMPFKTSLVEAMLAGGREMGVATVDLNTLDSSPGFMEVQVTGRHGSRWSAEHALRLALHTHNNLQIVTDTSVDKVLLRQGVEAYGVVYRQDNLVGKVLAKEAVILSAGAIGSPKILMLSGIGPKEHLKENGINAAIDLPVGENLQDHVTTGLDLVLLNYSLPLSSTALLKAPINTYQYFVHGNGVMTHPGCEVVGLFHSGGSPAPDLQLIAIPAGISTDAGAVLRHAMGISDKVWTEYFAPLVGQQVATILPTLLHPKSRGSVRLTGPHPSQPPAIDPRYLSHPEDIALLVRGVKLLEQLVGTDAMSQLGARLNTNKMSGCESWEFGSDPYWECYVRQLTLTAYHPVGTCSMGSSPDNSVVSHSLRVHNTNKLYVVDASVMPSLPSANINAAVMMVAEKAADLIKYQYYTKMKKCKISDVFYTKLVTEVENYVNQQHSWYRF